MAGPRSSSMTKQQRGRTTSPGQSAGSGRKRWLRIGPGLALALVAILLLWPTLRNGLQSDRPRIERNQSAEIPAPPAAPELGWLLEQKDALRLTPAQVEKFGRLKTRWDRETQPLRQGLDTVSREFNRGMEARDRTPRSIQALQERAAPQSDLSRRLAGARRVFRIEAGSQLTSAQRQQAEEAWSRHLASGRRTSSPR